MSQGVYRVPQAPCDEHTRLRHALLWTRRDDAVPGFETALGCYGACDIFSDDVHVVVPSGGERPRARCEVRWHRADTGDSNSGGNSWLETVLDTIGGTMHA